jgi:Holliday junction DNA helicase RuvB
MTPTMDRTVSAAEMTSVTPFLPATYVAPDLEMVRGLATEDVCRMLGRSSRCGDNGRRVTAFYLVEMDARRLHLEKGCSSTLQYAEEKLELDRRRCGELLFLGRKLLELEQLDRAFREGKIGWVKVQIVARVATREHEADWVAKATELGVRELLRLVRRSKAGGPPRPPGDHKGLSEIRWPARLLMTQVTKAKVDAVQHRLHAELGRPVPLDEALDIVFGEFLTWISDGSVPGRERVNASIYRVQMCNGKRPEDPVWVNTEDGPFPIDEGGAGVEGAASEAVRCDAGVRTHHGHDHRARDIETPPWMRNLVLRRDGYRCRACRSRVSIHAHHIEFRSHGGRTLLDNLITVCERCHGLIHGDLLRIVGGDVKSVTFVDRTGRRIDQIDDLVKLERELQKLKAAAGGAREVQAGGTGAAGAVAVPSEPERVTLSRVPAEMDAAWWIRHAHLMQDRGERNELRFVSGTPEEPPVAEPARLAPASEAFEGLVGQAKRIERLQLAAQAAQADGERFPHVLLQGPAGTGKTTIARSIATLVQQPLVEVSGDALGGRANLIRLLAGLQEGSVLFLDEAQALPKALHETLLNAMAGRTVALVLSDGARAKNVRLRLPGFTLVAATTNEGSLPGALRSRFGLVESLEPYAEEQLAEVVQRMGTGRGLEVTPQAALSLARVSRGTPREAKRLLAAALHEPSVRGTRVVDDACVHRTLERLEIDADGVYPDERRYLRLLRESRRPISLQRIAMLLGKTVQTVAEIIEPWLVRRGLVRTTLLGRTATPFPVPDDVRAKAYDAAPNGWRAGSTRPSTA